LITADETGQLKVFINVTRAAGSYRYNVSICKTTKETTRGRTEATMGG